MKLHVKIRRKWSWGSLPGILMLLLLMPCSPEAFAGTISFNPSISVEELYNSNIFYLDRYEDEDVLVSFGFDLPLEYSDPSRKLTLSYAPFAEFYRDHSDLNYVRHSARSLFEYRGKASSWRISEMFYFTQVQGEPAEGQEPLVGALRRTDITSNDLDMTYSLRIKNSSILNIRLNHRVLKYDDLPDYDFEDATTFSTALDNLFTVGRVHHQAGYFYEHKRFLYESLENQDSDALGFLYQYRGKYNILARAGGFKISGDDPLQERSTEPAFSFETSRIFRKGSLRIRLSRDLAARGGLKGLSRDDGVSLGGSLDLTRRSTLGFSSTYYNRKPVQGLFAEYHAYAINPSWNIRIYRNLVLSVIYRRFVQRSREDEDLNGGYHLFSIRLRMTLFPRTS